MQCIEGSIKKIEKVSVATQKQQAA